MTLPIQIPITGTYQIANTGIAAPGKVVFRAVQQTVYSAVVQVPQDVVFTLDVNGHFSGTLQATNDPAVLPINWAYQVFEVVPNGRAPFFVEIDYRQTAGYDMWNIAPMSTPPLLVSSIGPQGPVGPSGSAVFATFSIDPTTGILSETTPDGVVFPIFSIDASGNLGVNIA